MADAKPASAAESPRCGCETVCGDLAEEKDHPNAHCKGLPPMEHDWTPTDVDAWFEVDHV